MEKVLYTVKEVSQILHTNPSYVYQLIALMKFLSEYEGYDLSDPKNVEKLTVTA